MAESRLITISKAELDPNPVQTGKSYIVRVTLEKKAYWLDYPYDYAHDYAKGDESMSVKTVQAVICRLPSKTAICAMFGGQCVT